jgi:hypothetical protein
MYDSGVASLGSQVRKCWKRFSRHSPFAEKSFGCGVMQTFAYVWVAAVK